MLNDCESKATSIPEESFMSNWGTYEEGSTFTADCKIMGGTATRMQGRVHSPNLVCSLAPR